MNLILNHKKAMYPYIESPFLGLNSGEMQSNKSIIKTTVERDLETLEAY